LEKEQLGALTSAQHMAVVIASAKACNIIGEKDLKIICE